MRIWGKVMSARRETLLELFTEARAGVRSEAKRCEEEMSVI